MDSKASPEGRIGDADELHAFGEDVQLLVRNVGDHRSELGHGALADLVLGEIVDVVQAEDRVTLDLLGSREDMVSCATLLRRRAERAGVPS